MGFDITLFFLGIVVIPIFYISAVTYNQNIDIQWSSFFEQNTLSTQKILIYSVLYSLVFLIFILNLSEVFFERYKPMFAFLSIGITFSLVLAVLLSLLKKDTNLKILFPTFFALSCLLFSMKVPGLGDLNTKGMNFFHWMVLANFLIFILQIFMFQKNKDQDRKGLILGIGIGIISPITLYLLTYGI